MCEHWTRACLAKCGTKALQTIAQSLTCSAAVEGCCHVDISFRGPGDRVLAIRVCSIGAVENPDKRLRNHMGQAGRSLNSHARWIG